MLNVAPILEQQLLPEQLRHLKFVSDVSRQIGLEVFLVGGTVRDIIMGRKPADLDLSVAGGAIEFAEALTQKIGGKVVSRSQFGTCKLKTGNFIIDLASARSESYRYPGALPTVATGSIQEDLARRDFSVNAMAVSLVHGSWGDLMDPFEGQHDIQMAIIRVLHPNSFADDATRILRAIRYSQRLGFRLENKTEELIKRDLSNLNSVTGDRIRHELERCFREEEVADILSESQKLGVLYAIHPSLYVDKSLIAKLRQISVEPTLEIEKELLLVAMIAYRISDGDHSALIDRLSMDSRWMRIVNDTGSISKALRRIGDCELRPSQIYELLHRFDDAAIKGCALSTGLEINARRLELYLDKLRHVRPILNGVDLVGMGVEKGPAVGEVLHSLRVAKMDGLLTTKEGEEEYVSRYLEEHVC